MRSSSRSATSSTRSFSATAPAARAAIPAGSVSASTPLEDTSELLAEERGVVLGGVVVLLLLAGHRLHLNGDGDRRVERRFAGEPERGRRGRAPRGPNDAP